MPKCLATSDLGGQEDTYLYALARCAGTTYATIGSDDGLRIFDGNTLKPLWTASNCHAGVACLASAGDSHFVTGGRDGMIRCWDTRARKVSEMADPRSNGISALACVGHYIAAGTESIKEGLGDVSVLFYDIRNPTMPLRQYNESHTDTITQLAFHPAQPNLLLSGSTDGLISIFDVDQEEEEDALQQVLNPRSAVHCAGFLAQDLVYSLSTDEQYSIHTLAKTALEDEQLPPPIDFGDVREKLQCMYVVNVTVRPDGPPLIAYGHTENQTLSISSLGSPGAWEFGQRVELAGAHGEEVVRDLLIYQQRALTCGEDGKVKLWKLDF